jgi:aspartyl-tRNA(Asn)/glutamyl-tRNA(Gln) amidotransferase subunit B
LPQVLFAKYSNELKLSDYDAHLLTDQKEIALYFEEIIKKTTNYKASVNWLMGDIKSYLNANGLEIRDFKISPVNIAGLINLIDSGKISNNLASQKVFPEMLIQNKSAQEIAEENDWIQNSNEDEIKSIIQVVFQENKVEFERLKQGDQKLMGFFMGKIMQKSQGKADPKSASKLINELIKNS